MEEFITIGINARPSEEGADKVKKALQGVGDTATHVQNEVTAVGEDMKSFFKEMQNELQLDKIGALRDVIDTVGVSVLGLTERQQKLASETLKVGQYGAEIGTIFGPWGTVIGGAIGAVAGYIGEANKQSEEWAATLTKVKEGLHDAVQEAELLGKVNMGSAIKAFSALEDARKKAREEEKQGRFESFDDFTTRKKTGRTAALNIEESKDAIPILETIISQLDEVDKTATKARETVAGGFKPKSLTDLGGEALVAEDKLRKAQRALQDLRDEAVLQLDQATLFSKSGTFGIDMAEFLGEFSLKFTKATTDLSKAETEATTTGKAYADSLKKKQDEIDKITKKLKDYVRGIEDERAVAESLLGFYQENPAKGAREDETRVVKELTKLEKDVGKLSEEKVTYIRDQIKATREANEAMKELLATEKLTTEYADRVEDARQSLQIAGETVEEARRLTQYYELVKEAKREGKKLDVDAMLLLKERADQLTSMQRSKELDTGMANLADQVSVGQEQLDLDKLSTEERGKQAKLLEFKAQMIQRGVELTDTELASAKSLTDQLFLQSRARSISSTTRGLDAEIQMKQELIDLQKEDIRTKEIETRVLQIVNDKRREGIELNDEEVDGIREKVTELQDLNEKLKDSTGPLSSYISTNSDLWKGLEQVGVNALGSLENAFIDFLETGKFDFAKFARSVELDLIRVITRVLILESVAEALKSALSGLGGGSLAGVFGSAHEGWSGSGPMYRHLPRFHTGGVAGGGDPNGEFPAVLRRGEAVVPLLNGQKIPVEMNGGSGPVQNFNLVQNIKAVDAGSFHRSRRQTHQDAAQYFAMVRRQR